jgi:hypothetical protein
MSIRLLAAIFGAEMMKQMVVVWTHGDMLVSSSLTEYLSGASSGLHALVDTAHASVVAENGSPGAQPDEARLARSRTEVIEACRGALEAVGGKQYMIQVSRSSVSRSSVSQPQASQP